MIVKKTPQKAKQKVSSEMDEDQLRSDIASKIAQIKSEMGETPKSGKKKKPSTPSKPMEIDSPKPKISSKPVSEQKTVSMEVDKSVPKSAGQLTKVQKKHLREKLARQKRAEKLAQKPKKEIQTPLPSSIKVPKKESTEFVDPSALIAENKRRIDDLNNRSICIRPIPHSCPTGLLQDLCPSAIHVRFPMKHGAGFAFLEFKNRADAIAAATSLNGREFNGHTLIAKVNGGSEAEKATPCAQRKLEDFDLFRLFVTGLSRNVTRLQLAALFPKAVGIRIHTFTDGSCKGSCILIFTKEHLAKYAFTHLHGTFLQGKTLNICYVIKPQKPKQSLPKSKSLEKTKPSAAGGGKKRKRDFEASDEGSDSDRDFSPPGDDEDDGVESEDVDNISIVRAKNIKAGAKRVKLGAGKAGVISGGGDGGADSKPVALNSKMRNLLAKQEEGARERQAKMERSRASFDGGEGDSDDGNESGRKGGSKLQPYQMKKKNKKIKKTHGGKTVKVGKGR